MQELKAIVIGSGIGGMAIAIRLACVGYQVDLFEKNPGPGGKISSFNLNGFQFDSGPSLFTEPENITELFELAGEELNDYFSFQPLRNACRYFFPDGKVIDGYCNPEAFSKELSIVAGEDPSLVIKYLQKSKLRFESIGNIFLNKSLNRPSTWLNREVLRALRYFSPSLIFSSLNDFNSSSFTKPETIKIFNRFATYNGSDPYRAPAMLSMIPHIEHGQGIYYPKNGMISIVGALYALAQKKGVRFHLNSEVTEIVSRNKKVYGVKTAAGVFESEVIISNADLYSTARYLLKDERLTAQQEKTERSTSAMVFYLGVDFIHPDLYLHNIFFSADQRREFGQLAHSKMVIEDPTIYLNITSLMDPSHAPGGMQNWFVMVNVPASKGPAPETMVSEIRRNILKKLNERLGVEVDKHIKAEAVMTPGDLDRQTSAWQGALYGASSNRIADAFRRQPNFSRKYKGLFFVGGTVHPGGGIPLCFRSAKIAAGLITGGNRKQTTNDLGISS